MTFYLYQLAQRTHLLFLPAAFLLITGAISIIAPIFSSDDMVRETLPYQHYVGTTLLFVLMPAYLFIALVVLWDNTENMLTELAPESSESNRFKVRTALTRTPSWRYLVLIVGFFFGLSQNGFYVEMILKTGDATFVDVVFIFQSVILWVIISDFIAWRISVIYGISKFAQTLDIGVYETARYNVVAKVATTDVLIVAAAMAFMPLQSLDAAFRIQNYQAGIIIGISTAFCVFTVPLIGARQSIIRLKQIRLAELQNIRRGIPTGNINDLEAQLAHEDRIRGISNWPIDLQLFARIVGYVIIPPLAWVGAAMVERMVNSL